MTFALDLKAFADKTNWKVGQVVRKIIIDVGTSLVMKSPVGDADYWKNPPPKGYVGGRFRANWQYSLEAPNLSTTESIDPEGGATINAIVGNMPNFTAGKRHFITNSLPYAQRLEEGWSHRQAPFGMVGLTITEFEPIVAAAAEAFK